jgi:S1-C subfamily serine protease
VAWVALVVGLVVVGAVGVVVWARDDGGGSGGPSARTLASGVGLVQLLDCKGKPLRAQGHTVSGSGFLVGEQVVMTAEHGLLPLEAKYACGVRVRFGDEWYQANGFKVWRKGDGDWRGVDLAAMTLSRPATGHIFAFAHGDQLVGSQVTAIGYPLGGPLRFTSGPVTRRLMDYGIPTLAARLEIEGGNSGGPIVDENGDVVSVVSRIVIWANLSPDGKHHHGGIDLWRWWGESIRTDLCGAYPDGGVPGCAGDDASLQPKRVSTPIREATFSP